MHNSLLEVLSILTLISDKIEKLDINANESYEILKGLGYCFGTLQALIPTAFIADKKQSFKHNEVKNNE